MNLPKVSPTTSFLELLGHKNYLDVLAAYKSWLEGAIQSNTIDDGSLEKGELSTGSHQPHQRHPNMISKELAMEDNNLDEKIGSSMKVDQALAEEEVEVVSTLNMANEVFKEILRLHDRALDESGTRKKLDDVQKPPSYKSPKLHQGRIGSNEGKCCKDVSRARSRQDLEIFSCGF
jgi:hypothetical protein